MTAILSFSISNHSALVFDQTQVSGKFCLFAFLFSQTYVLSYNFRIVPFSLFLYNEELNEKAILEHESKNEPVQRSLTNFKQQQSKFLKSITARLTVAQVVSNVKSNAEITFDFTMYVLLACCIAAMGLLENSVISLVASMLVSPMMVCFPFFSSLNQITYFVSFYRGR